MLQGFTLAIAVLAIASVAAAPAQADDIKAAVMIIETGSINQPAVESVPGADVLATKRLSAEEAFATPKQPSWILRQIIGLTSAMPPRKQPIETAAIPSGPRRDAPAAGVMVAEADPNFGMWQEHAKEKLKHENGLTNPKDHPLAAAYPDSYVVVCEAGCREQPGHIVYMVTKVAAATGVKSTLETTSSETQASTGTAAVNIFNDDPRALPCVAGCYDRPEPRRTPDMKKAETTNDLRTAAVASVPATPAPRDALQPMGATPKPLSIAAQAEPAPKAVLQAIMKARRGWKATVVRAHSTDPHKARGHRSTQTGKLMQAKARAMRQSKFSNIVLDALR